MVTERLRNSVLPVDTTNVVASNDMTGNQRKLITITNSSTGGQVITIAFGQEAVANIGVVLYPTGSWGETLDSQFIPTNAQINAIGSAAGGQISIHERILTP